MNNQTNPKSIYRFLWPLTFVLITISAVHPLTNFDFWWHLASARYILSSGQFPTFDYLFKVLDENNRSQILQELDRSIAIDSTNAKAYFLKAKLTTDKSAALTNYQQVLALNPHWVEALFSLGQIYFQDYNDVVNARKYFQLTVNSQPDHFAALNNLALLSLQQSDYRQAEKFLLTIVRFRPDSFTARYNLIRLYQKTGSAKISKLYQWMLNNQELIPAEKRAILFEAKRTQSP